MGQARMYGLPKLHKEYTDFPAFRPILLPQRNLIMH